MDFDRDKFQSMLRVRQETNALLRANGATYLGEDQLELKCLLTSLAHSAYLALRNGFDEQRNEVIAGMHVDPYQFMNYYFSHSQCMAEAAAGPIVEYFLSTLQRFAEATETENILVFMPWPELAKCFRDGESSDWRLGQRLWEALGDLAGRKFQSSAKAGPVQSSIYNRVCLIVAGRHVPYGHRTYMPSLVSSSVWPIPSFTEAESRGLLKGISPAFDSLEAAEKLMQFTGGCPWLTCYALSYVKYLHQPGEGTDPIAMIVEACKLAGEQMPEHRPESPVSNFAHSYLARIRSELERGVATDRSLVDAWAGRKRRSGIDIDPRVEAFVASGLVWLEGDIWNNSHQNFVFKKFPNVRFREPGTLARIAYEIATNCKLPAATW